MPGYTVIAAKRCENFERSPEMIQKSLKEMRDSNIPFQRAAALSTDLLTAWTDFEAQFPAYFSLSILKEDDLQHALEMMNEKIGDADDAYLVIGSEDEVPDEHNILVSLVMAESSEDACAVASKEIPSVHYFGSISKIQIKEDLNQIKNLFDQVYS